MTDERLKEIARACRDAVNSQTHNPLRSLHGIVLDLAEALIETRAELREVKK